jgi:hypothetical protein
MFRCNLGVPLLSRGRYFFEVYCHSFQDFSTIRVGWATFGFVPDLGGMTAIIGDDEEVKLDKAGDVSVAFESVLQLSKEELASISPNGDAPVRHPIFPPSVEHFHRLHDEVPLLLESHEVLVKGLTALQQEGYGTGDISGDLATICRRVHVLLHLKMLNASHTQEKKMKATRISSYYKMRGESIRNTKSDYGLWKIGCVLDTVAKTIEFIVHGIPRPELTCHIDTFDDVQLTPLICIQSLATEILHVDFNPEPMPAGCVAPIFAMIPFVLVLFVHFYYYLILITLYPYSIVILVQNSHPTHCA